MERAGYRDTIPSTLVHRIIVPGKGIAIDDMRWDQDRHCLRCPLERVARDKGSMTFCVP